MGAETQAWAQQPELALGRCGHGFDLALAGATRPGLSLSESLGAFPDAHLSLPKVREV